jgi:hypothetical protein
VTEGWVNLTVPRGAERELCSHGEEGYVPFRAASRVWLVRVPPYVVPYLTRGAMFAVAPDELQKELPPDPASIRSVTHLYT